ncbi:MAG: hypothetical protein ACRCYX_12745 [Dermatophilaceae bacterium]
MEKASLDVCVAAFKRGPFRDSLLNGGFYFPGEDEWSSGYRTVVGYVYDPLQPTGRKLTGSNAKSQPGTT